jgi:competence protein ComEC
MATNSQSHFENSPTRAELNAQNRAGMSVHVAVPSGDVPCTSIETTSQKRERRSGPAPQPLTLIALALAAGIAFDRYLTLPIGVWFLVGISAVGIWWAVWRRLSTAAGRRGLSMVSSVALVMGAAACGGARHHMHWRLYDVTDIGRFAQTTPQPVCVEVIALAAPRTRPAPPADPLRSIPEKTRSTMHVRAVLLRDRAVWRSATGRATLTVDGSLPGIQAGDRLRVVGQLFAPAAPGNPGEFDFADYRRGNRELAAIRAENPDCVERIASGSTFSLMRFIDRVRSASDRQLWSSISRERAGLAAAVLLGAREQLDDDVTDQFLVTGTIHVLSISGLHVAILAGTLLIVFRTGWAPRRGSLVAVAVLTLAYTLVTDAEPPAIRATVLVWAACGAIFLGRTALGPNSLALAAIVVLMLNPADLFRTGTQLSFLSVATLMAVARRLRDREPLDPLSKLILATRPAPVRMARKLGAYIVELAFAGLAIWLVTTPLVLDRFHVVSFSSLVLNLVLWLPVLVAMISGFAVLSIGWLIPPLGPWLGAVCDWNLSIIERALEFSAAIPWGHAWTPAPPTVWLFGYYALLALPLVVPRFVRWRTSLALAIGCWAAGFFFAVVLHRAGAPDKLVCHFVDVGHGSAVLLELPDGQVWLYDAGRLGSPRAATRSIAAYLWSRRIGHIDALILSHADIDHYNAVPELLTKFSVGSIYISPHMFRKQTPPLDVLQRAMESTGVRVETLLDGRMLTADGCVARVLHPPAEGVVGNDNAQSLVLDVRCAGRRVLLTGDLEGMGLRRLLNTRPLDCDVLLAPHHGSPRSNPEAMISWSTPECAVFSSGQPQSVRNNPYHATMGPRALNTADVGAVRVILGRKEVNVRAWRIDPWE